MVSPLARRIAARYLIDEKNCSQRRSCQLVGVSRTVAQYQPARQPDKEELVTRIHNLAATHKRYGYRRITSLLQREGMKISEKKVFRIWKREGLSLPPRRPKRRRYGKRESSIQRAQYPNHVWSYDFVEDRTERGGRLRLLNIIDEYTRESLAIRIEPSIPAATVIEELSILFMTRGIPEHIRSDNGPEFISKELCTWLQETGCQTIYIKPGSPWENGYIESFNDKLRDECLNCEIFQNGGEAKAVIEEWRREYNTYRPHSSLGYFTPVEYRNRWYQEHENETPTDTDRKPVGSLSF